MGRNKKTAKYEDQFGEVGGSQDRDFFSSHGASKGSGGGGDAGGGRRTGGGANITFERHVPKFLQGYEHMLGAKKPEDDPVILNKKIQQQDFGAESDDNDDEQQEALRRALEEDPTLIEIHPELKSLAAKSKAATLKEKGNKAFAAQDYEKALEIFIECTEIDPDNEVYFSNKAAALTSLKRYDEAVVASRKVIQLKPSWAKGHSRLGASLFGLEEYGEARIAYEAAAKLEPDDKQLHAAVEKARMFEARQEAEHRHKFKKAKLESSSYDAVAAVKEKAVVVRKEAVVVKAPAVKNKTLLSFDDGNE